MPRPAAPAAPAVDAGADAGATRSERAAARPAPAERPKADADDGSAATVVASELAPGDRIGDYEVRELIGSGAFGVVVRAVHGQLGREVAIKVLKRAHAADAQAAGRFLGEARAVNRIRHPNIVDIYGFGELPDGRQYYVMDLLRGRSLAEALSAGARLAPARALRILATLADALGAAHKEGITHRDLKPENVFLVESAEGERPVLLDFGIARVPEGMLPHGAATRAGMVLGTPCYMAPEQALGEPVDARADVFALGVLAYRMLTGVLPWEGRSLSEVVKKQLHGPGPKKVSELAPGVPAHVDAAVSWMLAAERAARCPDVRSAVAALEGTGAAPAPAAKAVAAVTVSERRLERTAEELPSLTRLAEEEARAERSGAGRLVLSLLAGALLFLGGLYALDRHTAEKAPTVEFVFQGTPAKAEIVSPTGELLGRMPGQVKIPTRQLPTTVEVRAPGHVSQKRPLQADSLKLQLVTLTPSP